MGAVPLAFIRLRARVRQEAPVERRTSMARSGRANMPMDGTMITGLSGRNRRVAKAMAGVAFVAACGAALPGAAMAQPVVQSTSDGGSRTLNASLARLARDPRDLAALIDAGNAALQMGDVDAAVGFFSRADQLSPNNMRVKAGLAGALVRSENPYDAIPLFTEAERAGAMDAMLLSDRGLAYDLVGDNATAQRYYRQSLAAGSNDETSRRLALSLAIAGDRTGMEAALSPLLQRQDKSAWRTRAFSLAILGRADDAIAIANQTMPSGLASGIAPYLRYMPRLTPAQQAAAANFGRFPRAAEIGHDDPRVALYAPPKRVASADAGLVPAGEPLGRQRSRRDNRKSEASAAAAPRTPPVLASAAPASPLPVRSAPPEPMPVRQTIAAPALATAPPQSRPAPIQAVATVQPSAPPRPPAPTPQPASPALASASGFDLSRVSTVQSTAAPAVPPAAARPVSAPPPVADALIRSAAPPVAAPARTRRVSDAFADLSLPSTPAAPAPGAVDIRKIAAAKAKAEAAKVPPKPAHPSRIWVQVGTGRDIKALGFTWRGLAKDNPELFRTRESYLSDWGRTNRLLTGPFPSESAAQAFLAKLKKNDIDAFIWTSPAGQVVDELDAK